MRRAGFAWLLAAIAWLVPRALAEPHASVAGGFTLAAETRVAAHRAKGAPTVVVHAPDGFDPRPPLHLVVYLHGHGGCAQVLMNGGTTRCRPGGPEQPGWDLAGSHDAAGTNTLFVLPQLAFLRRDGDPGCFARRGCFRRFLDELLHDTLAERLGGPRSLRDVGSLTLVAHSGGFEAALAILEQGEVSGHVHAVILFDALYAHAQRYARWLLHDAPQDARMVSLHLGHGSPRRESKALLARVRRALGRERVAGRASAGALATLIARKRLVVGLARAPHRQVPHRHLAEVLAALPHLPRR